MFEKVECLQCSEVTAAKGPGCATAAPVSFRICSRWVPIKLKMIRSYMLQAIYDHWHAIEGPRRGLGLHFIVCKLGVVFILSACIFICITCRCPIKLLLRRTLNVFCALLAFIVNFIFIFDQDT